MGAAARVSPSVACTLQARGFAYTFWVLDFPRADESSTLLLLEGQRPGDSCISTTEDIVSIVLRGVMVYSNLSPGNLIKIRMAVAKTDKGEK